MGRQKHKPGDPRLAIGYLRVSTDKQDLGPEAQQASLADWARREGRGIIDTFLDKGVSGKLELEDRPGLVAALAAIAQHGAGVLLVAKRDRLARDVEVASLIERSVRGLGACVITADGIAPGDTPSDKFMRQMQDSVSEYERALIGLRT